MQFRGIEPTPGRLRVMEVIGDHASPMGVREICATVNQTNGINRVTVYRILDLLVEKGLVDRISGGRGLLYGMAPNEHHPAHPHFHCRRCGALRCLPPAEFNLDIRGMQLCFTGEISSVELRVTGICRDCLLGEQGRPMKNRQGDPE
jgi:Fur family ferric uptake transcriptional regulator